jgi:hypothetical protein
MVPTGLTWASSWVLRGIREIRGQLALTVLTALTALTEQ